jgi:hypothetical protein
MNIRSGRELRNRQSRYSRDTVEGGGGLQNIFVHFFLIQRECEGFAEHLFSFLFNSKRMRRLAVLEKKSQLAVFGSCVFQLTEARSGVGW